ncbi:hypothetical protein ACVWZD_002416 [Streptomyces sp. TE3672]
MPGPKKLDPSSSPRALPGAELRHRRGAGVSQEELGRPLFVSGSFTRRTSNNRSRYQGLPSAQCFTQAAKPDPSPEKG